LDCRLLPLGDAEIAADRGLVQAEAGMPARFFVFLRDEDRPKKRARARASVAPGQPRAFQAAPQVELCRRPPREEALDRAGLAIKVRWVPARTPFEGDPPGSGPEWIAVQQSLWAHALNLLTVAPGVLVGLDRHVEFYRTELGAECVDAEGEV